MLDKVENIFKVGDTSFLDRIIYSREECKNLQPILAQLVP